MNVFDLRRTVLYGLLLVLLALIQPVTIAYALKPEAKVCNQGDISLYYAKLHSYEDERVLTSLVEIAPGQCEVVARRQFPAAIAFILKDEERKVAYNPIYRGSGEIWGHESDEHIKSFCISTPTGTVDMALKAELVRELVIDGCPKGWVRIKTSFSILYLNYEAQLTLNAKPSLSDAGSVAFSLDGGLGGLVKLEGRKFDMRSYGVPLDESKIEIVSGGETYSATDALEFFQLMTMAGNSSAKAAEFSGYLHFLSPQYFKDDAGQIYCTGVDTTTGAFRILKYDRYEEAKALAATLPSSERVEYARLREIQEQFKGDCISLEIQNTNWTYGWAVTNLKAVENAWDLGAGLAHLRVRVH